MEEKVDQLEKELQWAIVAEITDVCVYIYRYNCDGQHHENIFMQLLLFLLIVVVFIRVLNLLNEI